MCKKEKKKLYRFEEVRFSLGLDQFDNPITGCNVHVEDREFLILKETPKGVWIEYPCAPWKKFVLLKAKKKFACLTKKEALISFKKRKERQIKILETQLDIAKRALRIADNKSLNLT